MFRVWKYFHVLNFCISNFNASSGSEAKSSASSESVCGFAEAASSAVVVFVASKTTSAGAASVFCVAESVLVIFSELSYKFI